MSNPLDYFNKYTSMAVPDNGKFWTWMQVNANELVVNGSEGIEFVGSPPTQPNGELLISDDTTTLEYTDKNGHTTILAGTGGGSSSLATVLQYTYNSSAGETPAAGQFSFTTGPDTVYFNAIDDNGVDRTKLFELQFFFNQNYLIAQNYNLLNGDSPTVEDAGVWSFTVEALTLDQWVNGTVYTFSVYPKLVAFSDDANENLYLSNSSTAILGRGEVGNTNDTAFGNPALANLAGGTGNTAIGSNTLVNLTLGTNNTAVGYDSGALNITANNNTSLGALTLVDETGNNNTAVGSGALRVSNAGTGNSGYNVALGYNAGGTINTGTSNVIIGAFSAPDLAGATSRSVLIGGEIYDGGLAINNAVVVGYESTVQSDGGVAVGQNAGVSDSPNGIAIGYDASVLTASANTLVIGAEATNVASCDVCVVIGSQSTVASRACVTLGQAATIADSSPNCVAIGQGATIGSSASNNVAIGDTVTIAPAVGASVAIGMMLQLIVQTA
jgi:hypothetical protein